MSVTLRLSLRAPQFYPDFGFYAQFINNRRKAIERVMVESEREKSIVLDSVSELITQARSIRRGLYSRCRAPFFAHMDVPMMANLVENYKSKYDRYPTDWAVLLYDAIHILRQGVEKAQNIATEQVKDALKGSEVVTTRGRYYFRKIDNQLSCSAYFGMVADDDRYPFPIYHELKEFRAEEIWRPEEEIRAARK